MGEASAHLWRHLAAAMVLAGAAALGGCTGGASTGFTTSGGGAARMVVRAERAKGDPMAEGALESGVWKGAEWHTLTGALNDPRSGPATKGALLFDSENLYVAFDGEEERPENSGSMEVWLDSTSEGKGLEMLAISVKPDGATVASWYRNTEAPAARGDGSPDYSRPVRKLPDYAVKGLEARSEHAVVEGRGVWRVVVKVPMGALPAPLKATVMEGARWRVNMLRYDLEATAGSAGPVVVQSNLSPIYQASQPLSPYRMAEVVLGGGLAGRLSGE